MPTGITNLEIAILSWAKANREAMNALLDGNAAVVPLMKNGEYITFVLYNTPNSNETSDYDFIDVHLDKPVGDK